MTIGCLIPFLLINDPGTSKAAIITHLQGGTWDASLEVRARSLSSDLTGCRAYLDICTPLEGLQVVWGVLELHRADTWNIAINCVAT